MTELFQFLNVTGDLGTWVVLGFLWKLEKRVTILETRLL